MKKVALYSRVSTDEQNPEAQMVNLRKYAEGRGFEVVVEYIEVITSRAIVRDKCVKMLLDASVGGFEAVIFPELSRLARSVRELIDIAQHLEQHDVDLICTSHPIDTSTAAGKLFFHIIAAFAEFEREIISERTKAAYNSGEHPNWGKRGPDKQKRKVKVKK